MKKNIKKLATNTSLIIATGIATLGAVGFVQFANTDFTGKPVEAVNVNELTDKIAKLEATNTDLLEKNEDLQNQLDSKEGLNATVAYVDSINRVQFDFSGGGLYLEEYLQNSNNSGNDIRPSEDVSLIRDNLQFYRFDTASFTFFTTDNYKVTYDNSVTSFSKNLETQGSQVFIQFLYENDLMWECANGAESFTEDVDVYNAFISQGNRACVESIELTPGEINVIKIVLSPTN